MTDETINDAEPDAPAVRGEVPPLRIHHILVATAVAAGFLSIGKLIVEADPRMDAIVSSGSGLLGLIATSVAMAVLGYAVAWCQAGRAFFHRPGHWLLLLKTVTACFYLCYAISLHYRRAGWIDIEGLTTVVYTLTLFVGWFVINGLAAWKGSDSRWWRLFFIMNGLLVIYVPVMAWFAAAAALAVSYCVQLVLLTVAVATDYRASRERDWPHWLGALLTFAEYLVGIVSTFFP